jgi:flagellar biosynthesis/type III secretory pathway protein FliH
MGVRAAEGTEHRYQLCRDEFCDKFPCRIYKEGRRDGYEDGHLHGWNEGYADGYSAGMAAASRG